MTGVIVLYYILISAEICAHFFSFFFQNHSRVTAKLVALYRRKNKENAANRVADEKLHKMLVSFGELEEDLIRCSPRLRIECALCGSSV